MEVDIVIFFLVVTYIRVKRLLKLEKKNVGLDFDLRELIGVANKMKADLNAIL